MIYLSVIVITFLSNFLFFSWYTRQLAKEIEIFEDRIDRKIKRFIKE